MFAAFVPSGAVAARVPARRPGSVQIRLLEAPAARRYDPRARIYIIDNLRPGTTISRKIGVTNRSGEPLRATLYAGAAVLGKGGFHPLEGRGGNELARWTRVAPREVDLRPNVEAVAIVSIVVPRDAAPGEHYGVVWAELPPSIPPGGGATEVNRVGIRMYLSVSPSGEPRSDFVIESLTASRSRDRTPMVSARVRNTGGRALDLSGTLRLDKGPGGLRAGPFPAQVGTILAAGEEGPVPVVLDRQIPDGPWDATMTLRSGLLERSASARITFPHEAGSARPVEPRKGKTTGLLLGALAVGLGAGGGVAALVLLLRRRKSTARSAGSAVRRHRRVMSR